MHKQALINIFNYMSKNRNHLMLLERYNLYYKSIVLHPLLDKQGQTVANSHELVDFQLTDGTMVPQPSTVTEMRFK